MSPSGEFAATLDPAPSSAKDLGDDRAPILLFVPGTMQSVFDQSTETIARQVEAAANQHVGAADFVAAGSPETISLRSGQSVETWSLDHRLDAGRSILLVRADYTPLLSQSFEASGIIVRFWRMLLFWFRVLPRICRIALMRRDPRHTPLTSIQRVFLIALGVAALLVFLSTAKLVADALAEALPQSALDWLKAALPDWFFELNRRLSLVAKIVGILAFIGLGLLAPRRIAGIFTVGGEYYGVVRNLLFAEGASEISQYLAEVCAEIGRRYPGRRLHVLCFSFGCVAAFDALFPREGAEVIPAGAVSSLAFIGFPYVLIEAGAPGYYRGSARPPRAGIPWLNMFLKNDVLGSEIGSHLDEVFARDPGKAMKVVDRVVAPQKNLKSWSNPVLTHMAYWSARASAPCEAIAAAVEPIVKRIG